MNWIDLVIIVILVFFTLEAFGKSFFLEVFDFLSFLLSFFLSLRFYNLASTLLQNYFDIPHSLANVIGFVIIWFLIEFLFTFLSQFVLNLLKPLSLIDYKLRFLSIIPGFFKGVVFVSIILLFAGTFPIQPKIKQDILSSRIGSQILKKTNQVEIPFKKAFGGITQDTFTFLTIKPKTNETVDLGFKNSEFKPNKSLENKMIELVNNERKKEGLSNLSFDPKLRGVSRAHSADMFLRGYFSHYSPEGETVADRAKENKIDFLVIGENLAYAPDLDLAHKGLMDSPGHRANILSKEFGKIGIGIQDGGVYGLMITQVFSN